MNKRIAFGVVGLLVVVSAGWYVVHTNAIHHTTNDTRHDHQHESLPGTHSSDHTMNMSVSSERDFISGMIPHHQEAVDTANEVLARGGTTDSLRQLAEAIIVAQTAEITEMKSWYELWYGEPYRDNGMYQPMMRPLADVSGQVLDRIFLEDMIEHHEMAIVMAESVRPYIEHPEIANLVEAIVTTQTIEISTMQQLLADISLPQE